MDEKLEGLFPGAYDATQAPLSQEGAAHDARKPKPWITLGFVTAEDPNGVIIEMSREQANLVYRAIINRFLQEQHQ